MKKLFPGRLAGLVGGQLLWAFSTMAQVPVVPTPAWQTALSLGTPPRSGNGIGNVVPDSAGNVYLSGSFRGIARFGSIQLAGDTSLRYSNVDGFVAKWNPTSGFVWAVKISGADLEGVAALAVRGRSLYLAGSCTSPSVHFGPLTLTNSAPTPTRFNQTYVARLTDLGTTAAWAWAQPVVGAIQVSDLAVSGSSLYLAGTCANSTTFGALTFPTPVSGTVIAKLTDTGTSASWGWSQLVAGSVRLANRDDTMYVAGTFFGPTISFGSTTLTNVGASNGSHDLYVAKLIDTGPAGTWEWAQRGGGPDREELRDVAVSGNKVYVTGIFYDPTITFGSTTLTNAGVVDLFVARLTDTGQAGSWTWAQRAGGSTGPDHAVALAVRQSAVYVAGYFSGLTSTFGATTLQNAATRDADVFLAKLTDTGTAGTWAWARSAGGTEWDVATAVAVGPTGNVVLAGHFLSRPATFGPLSIWSHFGTDGYTSFLAVLNDPLPTLSESVSLSPNPARGSVQVAGSGPTATLLDGLGRPVRIVPLTDGAATLDLLGVRAGLYLVRAGSQTRRLVVE